MRRSWRRRGRPRGSGPLLGAEPATGRPLSDPVLADSADPRWEGPPGPTTQSLTNANGSPDVMPPRTAEVPIPLRDPAGHGTPQDQAARPIEGDVGADNIREGRGGGTANAALAEGGDNG